MTDPRARAGWSSARREVAIAAVLALAAAGAAWAIDGSTGAGVTLIGCVVVSLVTLRALIDRDEPAPTPATFREVGVTPSFRGFWRTQADLHDATLSLSAWDHGTRPGMTSLLAARLSEFHGISLADDPDAARRLLMGARARPDLWYWVDPQRPTPPDASSRPGIPPKVLAALITRLEQL